MNRYIKFIYFCCNRPTENICKENHHICPKAKDLFPEYRNINLYKWNSVKLTGQQHFIAHWLLWKAFPNTTLSIAFILMSKKNRNRLNGKSYERLREEFSSINGRLHKGKKWNKDIPHFNKGKIRTTKEKKQMSIDRTGKRHTSPLDRSKYKAAQQLRFSSPGFIHPRGMLGKRHTKETSIKMSQKRIGKVWWHRGLETKMALESPGIDWIRGRTKQLEPL